MRIPLTESIGERAHSAHKTAGDGMVVAQICWHSLLAVDCTDGAGCSENEQRVEATGEDEVETRRSRSGDQLGWWRCFATRLPVFYCGAAQC